VNKIALEEKESSVYAQACFSAVACDGTTSVSEA